MTIYNKYMADDSYKNQIWNVGSTFMVSGNNIVKYIS